MSRDVVHVLGIESSCDDTGVAIVRNDGQILSNCIHSQLKDHIRHGGIIPMMAREYHLNHIDHVAKAAFQDSKLESIASDIDAISVTTRPGLQYSLDVGLNYARKLAMKYSKPIIPIHHMQAHALMPLLENRLIRYPFLALLLSGGHCLISICKRFNDFELIGSSTDDAPGDLLDKIARRCRIRNLGSPFDSLSGGAAIEILSKRKTANRFKYFNKEDSVPMLSHRNCDFSFSGYRGNFDLIAPHIDHLWRNSEREKLLDELGHLSASIQRSILIQVVKKLQRAIAFYRMHWRYSNTDSFSSDGKLGDASGFGIRSIHESDFPDIVISGGVAANSYLVYNIRRILQREIDESINVYAPSKSLCSDNGLMIAWNGMMRYADYLQDRRKYDQANISPDETVITDSKEMDSLKTSSSSLIGTDIRHKVDLLKINLLRLGDPEVKLTC